MDLQQLRSLLRIAETGNFTRAAEQLGVSQPALSHQIAKLEQELAHPVFERLGRRVEPTEVGRMLVDYASRIIALTDEVKQRVHDATDWETGPISVAAIPTIAPYVLPKLLKRFQMSCPDAEVRVIESVTEQIVGECQQGRIDIAIMALPLDEKHLHVEPLFDDELLLALPADHPLVSRKRVPIGAIEQEEFILLNEAHCLTENVLAFCRRKDVSPAVSCSGSQLATVQQLVALGQGVSLIPRMAAELDRSRDCIYLPVVGKPSRTIALVWNRNRLLSRLSKLFAETARDVLRRSGL